jgi:hypothetical protein
VREEGLPWSSVWSLDPITSASGWDSSSSIDVPPGLPTITNYSSPRICIMFAPRPLLVSKILLDNVALTRGSPSFTTWPPHDWCTMAVYGDGILCARSLVRSRDSHRWHAKGIWGIPVYSSLASRQAASFTMKNGFFH